MKAKRGGKRTGAGRPRGAVSKVTAEVREMARQYGSQAIERLAQLMLSAESEAAQIAAAKEILDRGYGKSCQSLELTGKGGAPITTRTERDLTDEELAAELAKHGIEL